MLKSHSGIPGSSMRLHAAQIIQLRCTGTGLNQVAGVLLLKKTEYWLSLFCRNANSSDVKFGLEVHFLLRDLRLRGGL